ncbi:unnamed protein product [Paramecium primaurelia]|nr:unnamed protein product [Paramecium primaurelia]
MIKENDRYNEDSKQSIQNYKDSTEYEMIIIDYLKIVLQIQNQNRKLTNLKCQSKNKKAKSNNQILKSKMIELFRELINEAQNNKRNIYLKEINRIKKSTYQILQKFVKHQIYDENDENHNNYESNIENIIEEFILSQKCQINQISKQIEQILKQQNIVIQNNEYNTLEQYLKDVVIQIKHKYECDLDYYQTNIYKEELKRLQLAFNLFINDSVLMINNQLNQKHSFCKLQKSISIFYRILRIIKIIIQKLKLC